MRRPLRAGLILLLLSAGCASLAPKYRRPTVEIPAAYKESWKTAEPKDDALHGKWWEMYNEPELSALETRIDVSNQNIAASFAAFLQARAVVKEARSQFFPALAFDPSAATQGGHALPANAATNLAGTFTQYTLPFDASWAPDLWGRVQSSVAQAEASAQVAESDLENTRLTQQSELAVDYFELRSQDRLAELLQASIAAYRTSLELTRVRRQTGIDSDEAVAQAETQLKTAQAQADGVGVTRAQYEHAIALLLGKPASSFALPHAPLKTLPPVIPAGVPSELLERRPDIAAAERGVAAANAQIGVAIAAFFPSLTLTGRAGFGGNSLAGLAATPEFLWSLGASLAETVFNGGLREATVEQYKAAYEQTVASYKQTVLTAFAQVEDGLSTTRILAKQIRSQDAAIEAAQRYLKLANDRYRLGIDPYLNVMSAEVALINNQQTAVQLRMQQMTASVQLIEALGGGWHAVSSEAAGRKP